MPRTVTYPAFDAKDPSESILLGFDFAALAASINGATVTATRHAGSEDAAPSAILSGAATVSGSVAYQRVIGGVAGTDYALRCTATTAAGDTFVLVGVLPVRAA